MDTTTPAWAGEWGHLIGPGLMVLLIVMVAMLVQRLSWRLIRRGDDRYHFPAGLLLIARRLSALIIYSIAFLVILERLGVSGRSFWAAFTGFAAVGAVAFFAAWSVLSNLFCTMLIYGTRPFRVHDTVEILENGDKPGLKGRVRDIHLVYTTLEELLPDGHLSGTVLQVPNNMFFQRVVRRWSRHASTTASRGMTP
jgi:small-conductance mechanosensitive channel